jgi:hypothetical protein
MRHLAANDSAAQQMIRLVRLEISHLDETSPSVQIHVDIFYFSIVREFVQDIVFLCFFMHTGDENDPTFHG